MKITFLGTGTSQGVPIIACQCPICVSNNPKDNRLRSSILIHTQDGNLVIDSGPDFRQQMLRQKVDDLRALIFTHGHKDHTAGMDDIRAFNYILQKPIDIYADETTIKVLKKDFDYYASRALRNKNTIVSLPAIPEDFGTVSAVMSLAKDAFMVELTRQTDTQQRVRFLVEKQRDDNGQTELLVHHVTFGASI